MLVSHDSSQLNMLTLYTALGSGAPYNSILNCEKTEAGKGDKVTRSPVTFKGPLHAKAQ